MPLEVIGWIHLWIGGVAIFLYGAYRLSEPRAENKAPTTEPRQTWEEKVVDVLSGIGMIVTLLGSLAYLPYGIFLLYAWPLIFIVPWWLRRRQQKIENSTTNSSGPGAPPGVIKRDEISRQKI